MYGLWRLGIRGVGACAETRANTGLSRTWVQVVEHRNKRPFFVGKRLRFTMDRCRVQDARRRKGLPDFPCRPVGIVEFTTFARTIDPRIVTTCLHCPPDPSAGTACAWEFALGDDDT